MRHPLDSCKHYLLKNRQTHPIRFILETVCHFVHYWLSKFKNCKLITNETILWYTCTYIYLNEIERLSKLDDKEDNIFFKYDVLHYFTCMTPGIYIWLLHYHRCKVIRLCLISVTFIYIVCNYFLNSVNQNNFLIRKAANIG